MRALVLFALVAGCTTPDAHQHISAAGTCVHTTCREGQPLSNWCSPCVGTVCANDSYCCTDFWDDQCVAAAAVACGGCVGTPDPDGGAGPSPGPSFDLAVGPSPGPSFDAGVRDLTIPGPTPIPTPTPINDGGAAQPADLSVTPNPTPVPTPVPTPAPFTHLNTSGSVALGEMKMFPLPIPAGRKVVIKTTSAVDIDLYIQFGVPPTTSAYLARGYTSSGNETLTYTATSTGTLYIGVHGYRAGAFTLKTTD